MVKKYWYKKFLIMERLFHIMGKNMKTKENTNAVQSISRAAKILYCLNNGINTVTDIAKSCDLSKSTVHRLLKALKESSLAAQDPTNQSYLLGPLITRISSNLHATHNSLVTSAIQEMTELNDEIEETIFLNVMMGIQYVKLYEIQSKHDLRIFSEYDPIGPVFVGAAAKVLLSQLTDEELRKSLKLLALKHVTDNSVTDKELLINQIRMIRENGYGISYGERVPGAVCLAAPIKDYHCPASISIVGPESRLNSKIEDLVYKVSETANRISEKIAGVFTSAYN